MLHARNVREQIKKVLAIDEPEYILKIKESVTPFNPE
jgi:hypothetical protein